MRKNIFRGVTTAMVTPFLADGSLDLQGLRSNTRYQLDQGINGLLPLGTTGETPTLSKTEKEQVVRTVIEEVKISGKPVPVMVGVGTNSTAATIQNAREAQAWGADAVLVVTPYYNKPTQGGILAHFSAVAEAVELPIVVYNIKGRTGTNIETPTLKGIAKAKNIIAVKEASGDISQMMDVLDQIPEIAVLSGDDGITFPLVCLGGQGVVSVISNLLPKRMGKMVSAALDGDIAEARQHHFKLMPVFKAAFLETNPGPIKFMMDQMGLAGGALRLPLVPIKEATKAAIDPVLATL